MGMDAGVGVELGVTVNVGPAMAVGTGALVGGRWRLQRIDDRAEPLAIQPARKVDQAFLGATYV